MDSNRYEITANVVDVVGRKIVPATLSVDNGIISSLKESANPGTNYLLPGFIDAHVHIESSMLLPREFARAAVVHGTVAAVSDPHEIANVLGSEGVRFMLDAAEGVPFKFCFGAPSCVPATRFETSGAQLDADDVCRLLDDPRIGYLSEMMDYPGVLSGDPQVRAKIDGALAGSKPVDGHAPGLRGDEARHYLAAGITTDHECFTRDEALDKLAAGAKILIREGSAARNFDALCSLLDEFPDDCMLCSDDKHPDDLMVGHINQLVQRAIAAGNDPMNALRAACVNPVQHYGLDVGLLRVGDDADFIEVDNLSELRVLRTFVRGRQVAQRGSSRIGRAALRKSPPHRMDAAAVPASSFVIPSPQRAAKANVIVAVDGQLITHRVVQTAAIVDGQAVADPERDILKIAVVTRYLAEKKEPSVAFVKGFGMQRGAIASSVAHDSHNVIAVGRSDDDLSAAVNLVIDAGGGLAVSDGQTRQLLPLPVAGLMSLQSCDEVAEAYGELDRLTKRLGCTLRSPFMTLSFMVLLVIPELKLSDQGLFDVGKFAFQPLFEDH